MEEMFESCCRSAGDLAGVFEYDDGVGYFYLYDQERPEGKRVIGSISVLHDDPDFRGDEVEVRWNLAESKVGLLIRGELWALFDTKTGEKYGGNYRPGTGATLPEMLVSEFS